MRRSLRAIRGPIARSLFLDSCLGTHGLFMIARIFRRSSGIAVLVVTGLLAWLTSRYVRLTREIANSSLEQVKLIGESARVDLQHNASALKALALRLRVSAPRFFVLKDYHRQTSPRSDYGSFSLALE